MAAEGDRDLRGADPEVGETYALVGELIEAHEGFSRAVTEYLVGVIGPPAGGASTLKAALARSHRRYGLLRAYGKSHGLRINYRAMDSMREARRLLAHNIDRVGARGVSIRKGGAPPGETSHISRARLRRHIREARKATGDLERSGP